MRIDWLAARRFYVEGFIEPKTHRHCFPTLREVAERFGVGVRTVEERSSKEGWPGLRAEFLREIAVNSQEIAARKIAEEIGETQVTLVLRTFRKFHELAETAYSLLRYPSALRPRDLKTIAETIKIAVEQQRLCLGLVSDRKAYEISVEDWRLELVQALREGRLTVEELREALGEEEARAILAKAQRLSMS